MPIFEIWSEGYAATGSTSDASFIGRCEGVDFRDACLRYFEQNPRSDFNPKRLTVWGCRLFDNEADARKAFG